MKKKVTGKQENSRMCFACGLKNPAGLRAQFFELDGGELLAVFEPRDEHQGYPGRLHGGIAATILDETICRVMLMRTGGQIFGVTVELTVRLRKPLPTNRALRVVGRIVKEGSRVYEGTGEILLEDGSTAVEAVGRFIKMPIDQIAEFDREAEEWRVVTGPADPVEVEVKE